MATNRSIFVTEPDHIPTDTETSEARVEEIGKVPLGNAKQASDLELDPRLYRTYKVKLVVRKVAV